MLKNRQKTGFRNIDTERLVECVKGAKKGDSASLEEIIRLTSDYIYYYCLMMLKNEENAKDAVQEIFIIIIQKIDTVNNPYAFLGWLKTVTSNYCKNIIIESRKYTVSADDGENILEEYEDFDDQIIPEEKTDSDETRRIILEIITNLPEQQRECILMYYYQEMSVNEIAKALCVNTNTVKSRLSYARQSIKNGVENLEKQGVKLYDLPTVSLISYVFSNAAPAVSFPVEASGIVAAASSAAVTTSVDAFVLSASTMTSGYISNVIGSSFATKLAAGAVTIALITGGGVVSFSNLAEEPEKNSDNESYSEIATPDKTVRSVTSSSPAKKKKKKHKKIKKSTPDTAVRISKPKATEPIVKKNTVKPSTVRNNSLPENTDSLDSGTSIPPDTVTLSEPPASTITSTTGEHRYSIPTNRYYRMPSTIPTSEHQYRIFN